MDIKSRLPITLATCILAIPSYAAETGLRHSQANQTQVETITYPGMPMRIDSAFLYSADAKTSLRYSLANLADEQINSMQIWLTVYSPDWNGSWQFSLNDKLAPGADIQSSQELDRDLVNVTRMFFMVLLAESADTLWYVHIADQARLIKELNGLIPYSVPDLSGYAVTKKSQKPEVQPTGAAHYSPPNTVGNPDVDTKPRALDNPRLLYPEEARQHKVNGVVKLQVLVGVYGEVEQVKVISGLPDGLSEEAIACANKIRFQPATKNGQPVPFWLSVDIEFNLR
jgi:TonB family protein